MEINTEHIDIEEIQRICANNEIYSITRYLYKSKHFNLPDYRILERLYKENKISKRINFKKIREEIKPPKNKVLIVNNRRVYQKPRKTIDLNIEKDNIIKYIIDNNFKNYEQYLKNKPKGYPARAGLKLFLKENSIELYNKIFVKEFFLLDELKTVLKNEGVIKDSLFGKKKAEINIKYEKQIPANWKKFYNVKDFNELMGYSIWEIIYNKSFSSMEFVTYKFLTERNISFEKEKTFSKLKGKKHLLRFDFYIQSRNLIIELDGFQHLLESMIVNDDIKNNYCKDNNISIIRINKIEDIEPSLNKIFVDYPILNNLKTDYNLINLDEIFNLKCTTACRIKMALLKYGKISKDLRIKYNFKSTQISKQKSNLIKMGLLNK